jgi:hypothetical protein
MTPKQLRPFPQAADMKGTANITRKTRAAATVTYTPMKATL